MKSTVHFTKNQRGLECLNCGQPLHGDDNFCSNCGQVNDDLPLSIKQFISEFFAGFFSFDTRFFRTIIPLLFKPGKVSREYIKGKRRKYTNPFKMYLHTSILFFLLMGLISSINHFKEIGVSTKNIESQAIIDSVYNDLKKQGIYITKPNFNYFQETYLNKLDSLYNNTDIFLKLQSDSLSTADKKILFDSIHKIGMRIQFPEYYKRSITLKMGEIEKLANFSKHSIRIAEFLQKYFQDKRINYNIDISYFDDIKENLRKEIMTEENMGTIGKMSSFSNKHPDVSPVDALDSLQINKTKLNIFKYIKIRDAQKLVRNKDFRRQYINSIISKISIALFFLLPIFTLFFSLLYIRHPFIYTEHLVVVFNIQTVYFIILIVNSIIELFSETVSDFTYLILELAFAFYIYKTLRNFYKQGRFKSIVKFIMLNFTFWLLAFMGFVLISFFAFII
jgi:hypothetical protein